MSGLFKTVVARVRAMLFDQHELQQIAELNRLLLAAYGITGVPQRHKAALRCYLETLTFMRRRFRMFEIANHRIFTCGDGLIVPYDAHGKLSIYHLKEESSQVLSQLKLPHGTLITDQLLVTLSGLDGSIIDLDREIYDLKIDDTPEIQVTRLRDLAKLLKRLNNCASRHEAVYLLRFLVARLCSTSNRSIAGAKNLITEAAQVHEELIEFMNGPFARRLRLATRVLVRNISGLVSRPKLIDEAWQDSIDLCEVHVRGSVIANEIRRSTHHAMGSQTLKLAQTYKQWLETGSADFPDSDRLVLTGADEKARTNPVVLELMARIVANLDQLLGSSQISTRLLEWRDAYANELQLCESRNTLAQELESLVTQGIQASNRWVYQRHLRILDNKVRSGNWPLDARLAFESRLDALRQCLPGDEGFRPEQAGKEARGAVADFAGSLQRHHQEALFTRLDELLECYRTGGRFQAFEQSCRIRHELENLAGKGVFSSQRYLLLQLDCVLEELGFFSLRHVASAYLDEGMALEECLRIVFLCAGNLELDGLLSRELWDLSAMLVNPRRSPEELLGVLSQIQRNYHRLVRRVSEAYEVMAEHLGYSSDEMRAIQGNFQRTMHDLNSLVHFSDLARTHISENQGRLQSLGSGALGQDPWDFVHLSHLVDIERRVSDREAVSLQARYGGKGAGLIYISFLGVPTRDAFIIPTVLPRMDLHKTESQRLDQQLIRHLHILEDDIARNDGMALRLGDPAAPLLLAVRGGSVFSMPGMLSTVVFAGMTDAVAEALACEDEWFAWDSFRRFLASYAAAVWHMDLEELGLVEKAKQRHGVTLKTDLPGETMREIVEASKEAIRGAGHAEHLDAILMDAERQIKNAMRAVHRSWDAKRACDYRAIKHVSDCWHTAVIVQQMACGNRSNQEELKAGMNEMQISLTGVIPSTRVSTMGFRTFTGDVKFSACGDDLVGGLTAARSFEPVQELRAQAPMLERKLNHISARLRRFLGSDAEIEFTVELGVLSILQTRSAEMEHHFSPRTFENPGPADGRGIGISGGAFRGVIAFNADDVSHVVAAGAHSQPGVDGILLVLENPIPDEIPLILSVDGLLAARGGSTSHAAVAVHGIDDKQYTAVLGVAELRVSANEATLVRPDGGPAHILRRGDTVSIHGQTGEVFAGSRPVLETVSFSKTRPDRR